MHRFFLSPDQTQGETICLQAGEAHHALHVLRLRPEDAVVVINGIGDTLDCRVARIEKKRVLLSVLDRIHHAPLPYEITLYQALPKGKAMDFILQKATEIGVSQIVPLLSERSVVRLDAAEAPEKQTKWEMVSIEAAKQCGTPWLPKIRKPLSMVDALGFSKGREEVGLVGSLEESTKHPSEILKLLDTRFSQTIPKFSAWVGPEGDFSTKEYQTLREAGVHPVTLGPYTLRSDTAALYLLSVLSAHLHASLSP